MNSILVLAPEPGEVVRLNARASHHVLHVLGKGVGDTVVVGLLHGPVAPVTIRAIEDGLVAVDRPRGPTPPVTPVELILALPRPKVMKRLWAPIASLGVERITVIGGDKVEASYFTSHAIEPDEVRMRLIEGLEQVRDTRLPEVFVEPSFDRFARAFLPTWPTSVRLFADPAGERRVTDLVRPGDTVSLAVGPEGGWTDRERETFLAHGFTLVSLGPRTLRTDTAVIALLTLVRDAMG
jgi:16S rRNA (uracil1498-N3)-methyltransferase